MQLFSETDMPKQKSSSLRKGIKSYQKVIAEHEDKIKNPAKYYPDWPQWRKQKQDSNMRHWRHEIRIAQQAIDDRIEELGRRGEKHD